MKKFLLRFFLVILIVFIQLSFLNLLVGDSYVSNLSVLLVIAWVITGGFEKTFGWIIFLGFLNDLLFSDKIGTNILFFTIFAYAVSFISKRFMIERRLSGFFLVVLFIVIGGYLGNFLNSLFGRDFLLEDFWINIKDYFLDGKRFFYGNILSGIYFYFIYSFVNMVEKYISLFENKLKITL